jgi:glycosyltransferase involved in cell wall biosynthesis
LGIGKQVRFVGFVPPEKLEQLYCTAEVYAIMSTAETQSLSLMQAFANGVPAVAAAARGLVDYCPPQCGYQVAPGDIEALAERLIELLQNKPLREQMGIAGVEFVKKFSPTHVAEEWEVIYATYKK